MKRKMLFFERLMYVDGHTPVNCIITARVSGQIAALDLKLAIERVQRKHPLLCATVHTERGQPYFTFHADPPDIPLRITERRSDDDWRQTTLKEWSQPFHMDSGPLIRVVWIRSDETSELMLVGHHCVCDGASLITIFREILHLTDTPDTSLTSYAPFESLNDLLPQEVLSSKKTMLRVKGKSILFRLFALTIKATPAPPPNHYFIYWKAGAHESSELINRCKVEGTTPFAALCVAFMQAFAQICIDRFKNKVMCPVNIRKFFKHIGPDVMFNYAPTISLAIEQSESNFWKTAKALKQSMSKKIERLNAYEHLMAAEELHGQVSKLISLLFRSKGSYDFAFSNVGRIDIPQNYKTFHIESFLGVTVAVPWRNATTLITSSYKGQTDLAFVSNDDFLPYAEAVAIKEKALELLSRAVGSTA